MSLNLAYGGNTIRTETPLVKPGYDMLRAVHGILGATAQPFQFSTDHVRNVEHFTVRRLAEGKQQVIALMLTSAMQDANPDILQLCPMIPAESLTFVSKYRGFPPELAQNVAPGSPPVYVTVEERSRVVTLDFYNLGATTTFSELRNPDGQMIWLGKLITVAIGFLTTFELIVIDALLHTPSLYAEYYLAANQGPVDLARAGRDADQLFDAVRRDPSGMGIWLLLDRVTQRMNEQNRVPTHVMIPEGTRALLAKAPHRLRYDSHGPGAAANVVQQGDSIGDYLGPCKIIAVRSIHLRNKGLHIAPLSRMSIGGQFAAIANFHTDRDPSEYRSTWMQSHIITMVGNGNWEAIGPRAAIKNCQRFGKDGRLSKWHDELLEDLDGKAHENGVRVVDGQYDMMVYLSQQGSTVVPEKCTLWGHMAEWALSDKSVNYIATVTKSVARRLLGPLAFEHLAAGLADISTLFHLETSADNTAFLRVAGQLGRYGVRVLPTLAELGAALGVGAAQLAFGDGANYRPFGYGTVGGYLELAKVAGLRAYSYLDQAMAARAVLFGAALERLHAFYKDIYTLEHPALHHANAPEYYRSKPGASATPEARRIGSLLAFATNVLDSNKPRLYLVPAAGGAAVAGGDEWEERDDFFYSVFDDIRAEGRRLPASIVQAFGTAAATTAFETEFAASLFARRYASYVETTRAARRATRAVAADAAAADELDAQNALQRFHQREIVDKQLSTEETIKLYSRVIEFVRTKTAPTRIDDDVLTAYAENVGAAQRDELQRDAPAGAELTGFSVSIDALRLASAADRDVLLLASPLDSTTAINIANAGTTFDAGTPSNLLTTTLTSARPNAPGGLRDATGSGPVQQNDGTTNFPTGVGATVYTDVVGSKIVVNTNITTRFTKLAEKTSDWETRVAGQMFILAPILEVVLDNMYAKNIPLPVAWFMFQPFRRYDMTSFVWISKPTTRPFGNVRVMDIDGSMGRDPIKKGMMLHMSMWAGATFEDSSDWLVSYDALSNFCVGGENIVPFSPENFDANAVDRSGFDAPSVFYVMVPIECATGPSDKRAPDVFDMRGGYDAPYFAGGSAHRDSQWANKPFYPALFASEVFGWKNINTISKQLVEQFDHRDGTLNTIVGRALQRVVNPHTGNFSLYTNPADQFGLCAYPGVGLDRSISHPSMYKDTFKLYTENMITIGSE